MRQNCAVHAFLYGERCVPKATRHVSTESLFYRYSIILCSKALSLETCDALELFIRPEERFTYRFSVLDDDNIEVPADSGFISLVPMQVRKFIRNL